MAKLPLPQAAVDAPTLHRVVNASRRTEPPAMVEAPERVVPINFKIRESLAKALAERAFKEGITQKQFVMRALVQAGLPVDPTDLEDRSGRRWRPSGSGEAA